MIGDCDGGEIGGMKIGKGNRSTRRKPAPAPYHHFKYYTLVNCETRLESTDFRFSKK
jgi:hypothetical protein